MIYELFGPTNNDALASIATSAGYVTANPFTRAWRVHGGSQFSIASDMTGGNGVVVGIQYGFKLGVTDPNPATDADWYTGWDVANGIALDAMPPVDMYVATAGRFIFNTTGLYYGSDNVAFRTNTVIPYGVSWIRTRIRRLGAGLPTALKLYMMVDGPSA